MIRFIVFFLLSVPLFACKQQKSNNLSLQEWKMENHRCKTDTSQHYVLYAPVNIQETEEKFPVVICFDPHADGALPLNKMAIAAKEYGFILAGSDNVKNGSNTAYSSAQTLIQEILTHYPVDPDRIYLAGFSGGARIALTTALENVHIRGVIAAGAGLPGFQPSTAQHAFFIYAMAGDGDFNYTEIETLEDQLKNTRFRVFSRIFHGTHAWPPEEELTRALQWICIQEINAGVREDHAEVKEKIGKSLLDSARNLQSHGKIWEAAQLFRLGSTMKLDGKYGKECKNALLWCQEQNEYRQYESELNHMRNTESLLREEYLKAFSDKDTAWWKKEILSLRMHTINEKSPVRLAMYHRLKGFLGIAAYSFTNRSLQSGNIQEARRMVSIYGILEPDNPDYLNFKTEIEKK